MGGHYPEYITRHIYSRIGFIWAPKIQTFAVSLLAIALALVLATKEIITCVGGSVVRMLTNTYTFGDRIEIGGIRGNVLDHNALHHHRLRNRTWSDLASIYRASHGVSQQLDFYLCPH